jgi:hypothetical protein
MFFAEARVAQRRGQIGRERHDAAVRRQFAADQYVVEIGIGSKLVYRTEHVREPHAVMPLDLGSAVHMTFHGHAQIERRAQSQHAQAVTIANALAASRRNVERDVSRRPDGAGH